MKRADFGARDEAIKTQTYSPVRRLDGLPHALFANYWRDVHGPLCSRLPGLGFYVQHHFSRERTANLWPRLEGAARINVVLDGAVEIGFASNDDAGKFVQASPILFGDEINCFGWDAAFALPKGSRTYIDQDPDGIPNGPDRLHRLHVYLHGDEGEAFSKAIDVFAAALANMEEIVKLRVHKPETFDNANPAPPSPVPHHVGDDMRHIAVLEVGFANALHAQQLFDSDAFQVAHQTIGEHVHAMNAFLVTHVYTFVRDGKPTMAGLRGSSAAEVIASIGATNHFAHDVTRLFVRA